MHQFTELVDRCTQFSLNIINETNYKIIEELQTSGATRHVKNLQMLQLLKVIMATGMFSIFESMLQDGLKCKDGFAEAARILAELGKQDLSERFSDYQKAINVLKHGRGRSYEALLAKSDKLPFNVKRHGQTFFSEGDVSEVSTLIEVDDIFVTGCAEIIRGVSDAIKSARPNSLH